MSTSPADAFDLAHKLPSSADPAVDAFSAAKARLTGVDPQMEESPFKGMKKYPVEYHARRFVIGNVVGVDSEGKKTLDDAGDTDRAELEAIIQARYTGEVIIDRREQTFLQDGTVIVWLEWLTPKAPPAVERPPHARTAAELLDPRVPPASEGAIPPEAKGPPAKAAQGSDTPAAPEDEGRFFGEDGPSFEDEDDF